MEQKNMIYIGAGGAVLIIAIAGIAIMGFGGKDNQASNNIASQNKATNQPPKILQQKKPISVKQNNDNNSVYVQNEASSDSTTNFSSQSSQNSLSVSAKSKSKAKVDEKTKTKKDNKKQQKKETSQEDGVESSTKSSKKSKKSKKNSKKQNIKDQKNQQQQSTDVEQDNASSKQASNSKSKTKKRPVANVSLTINQSEFKEFEENHTGLYSEIEDITRELLEEEERLNDQKKNKPSKEEIKQKQEDEKKFKTSAVLYIKETEKSKPNLNEKFDKFKDDFNSALNGVDLSPQSETYIEKVIVAFEEHRNKVYDKKVEKNQKNPFNPNDPGENFLNSAADLGIGCKFVDTKYQGELKEFISGSNKTKLQKIFQSVNPVLINNLQLIPFSISSVEKTGDYLLQQSYANSLLSASEQTKKYLSGCFYSQNGQGFIFTPLNLKSKHSAKSLEHIKNKLQKSTLMNQLIYRLIENKFEIAEVFTFANDLVKSGLAVNKFDFKNLVLLPDYESEEENVFLSKYFINDFTSLYRVDSPSEFEVYLNNKKKFTKENDVQQEVEQSKLAFSIIEAVRNMIIDSIPANVSYFKKIDSLKKVMNPLASKVSSKLNKEEGTKKQSKFSKKAVDQITEQFSNSILVQQFSVSATVEKFLNISISGEDSTDLIQYIKEFAAQYLTGFQKVTSVTVERLSNRKNQQITEKDAAFIQNILMLSLQYNDGKNSEYQTYLESMQEYTLVEVGNTRII